ncbi:MAG: HlyD family efflux transporter periplasmic adaptor subunit [Clostridia bacterium]|nr:HlyD family efflux transporter periplasmic adaptor subunit [Clostridia bacterium]
MKKILLYLFLCSSLAGIIYINFNVLNIKTVQATYLKQTDYTEQISVSGKFENKNKTYIVMSYPLYIKDVYVQENNTVYAGQALFSIDKNIMSAMLTAEYDTQYVNTAEYNQLKNYITSDVNIASLQALPDVFYSPCDGIVSALEISPKSLCMPNEQLVTIKPDNNVIARFSVSQYDFGKISVGDKVYVSSVAFPDKTYTGKISSNNAVVNKQITITGEKVSIDIFAHIDKPDDKIAEGLQVNGYINLDEKSDINIIDYSYIYQDDIGQYVYILKNGKAVKEYVETGIETEDYTQLITEFPQNTLFLKGNISENEAVIAEVVP